MPATATAARPTQQKGGQGATAQQSAAMSLRPFVVGTQVVETHTYDNTVTLTTNTQTLPTYYTQSNGFITELELLVEGTTSGNSAAVTFNADAPWNVLQTIQFSDTSSKPIMGPFTGFDLKCFLKYGGFAFNDDPQNSPEYSAVTGTGATGGSFSLVFRLPIEFVRRESLGPLPNTNNQTVFSVDVTLNTVAQVYGTAPTAAPAVRVRYHQEAYLRPWGKDIQGNPTQSQPPAMGTVMYGKKTTNDATAGAQNFRMSPFEGMVRTMIFILRDSTGSRTGGDADWPDPFKLHYDNIVPIDRIRRIWRYKIARDFGYSAAVDTAGGRDSGVYPLWDWIQDWELKPGQESRLSYLPVSAGTELRFDGVIGGSGTHNLVTLINYVNPANGNVRALSAR